MVSDRSESSHNTLGEKGRFKATVIERLLHIVVLRQQSAICSSLREFSDTRQLLSSVLRKCAQLSSLTMLPLPDFTLRRFLAFLGEDVQEHELAPYDTCIQNPVAVGTHVNTKFPKFAS